MSGLGPVQLITDYDNVFNNKRGMVLIMILPGKA